MFEKLKGFYRKECNPYTGYHWLFKYDNGYGASVIVYNWNYEVAVIKWDEDDRYTICYDTSITDDVIGGLNAEEVADILNQISLLDKNDKLVVK